MATERGVRIDVDTAKAKLESGEAIALDVVQPGAWERLDGAVKGALRISPQEIAGRLDELPGDLDVIAYCT
ncbi:MAG: rhodanese-like domain-containing protein [Actinomycetota bacterium]